MNGFNEHFKQRHEHPEHDHEHFEHHHEEGHEDQADMPLDETHPIWATERVELKSVGIDIGSSTSHLMLSRIVLRRMGRDLSSKFVVVSRDITYESDILLTPYLNGITINTALLSQFFSDAYKQAGISADDIDTGAVIVTGEAAKKENAEAIAAIFSVEAGKFVCAAAGPNLEAKMAACGSGAWDRSLEEVDLNKVFMSVDVGGGTSKIAIIQNGQILDTVAINVGARLIAWDSKGNITRIEDPGRLVARELGITPEIGGKLTLKQRKDISGVLAECLFNVLRRKPLTALTQKLMITGPISHKAPIDYMMFSGGVSEYIYQKEKKDYGDMGSVLAEEIRRRYGSKDFDIPVINPDQCIRATVIGASQYTVQVSGSTIFISDDSILPLRNLMVVKPRLPKDVSQENIAASIQESLRQSDIDEIEKPVVLALHWEHGPAYSLLKSLAKGILKAFPDSRSRSLPIVLAFDTDVAKLMGNMLSSELAVKNDIIAIDGIELQDFDYIDIGKELPGPHAVPVVIKSLIFKTGYSE